MCPKDGVPNSTCQLQPQRPTLALDPSSTRDKSSSLTAEERARLAPFIRLKKSKCIVQPKGAFTQEQEQQELGDAKKRIEEVHEQQ